MSEAVFERIKTLLEENTIAYQTYHHPKVLSSEEAAKVRGTKLEEATKALICKTNEEKFLQALVPGHQRLSLKKLRKLLKVKNIALASPEEVKAVTDCEPGSVPPFGNLFGIPVYMDEHFLTQSHVVFSAGTHYDSLRIKREDFLQLVKPILANITKDEEVI